MRIEDVNLGGGLFRLDVTPTQWGENVNGVPTRVMDNIMRDVVNRKKSGQPSCTCTRVTTPSWTRTTTTCQRHVAQPMPMGEPHGIDVHVDRPRRENYGGWDAQWGFENDMRKYRELERAAKACNWPCREPMKGLSEFQHKHMVEHAPVCGCHEHTVRHNELLKAARKLAEAVFAEDDDLWF